MKITLSEHSRSTKLSDLILLVFSVAYFLSGLCFAQDLFACLLFLICVIIIIVIKYTKINPNE